MNARMRTANFTLGVALLAILIGWATQASWRELHELRRSFEAIQSDGFHRSERVEAAVRSLSQTVLRFDRHRASEDRSLFQKESEELKQWLFAHPASTTPAEEELLDRIAAVFDAYVTRCTTLLAERTEARSGPPPNPLLDTVENEAAPLLDLCRKLKAAERATLGQFVKDSLQGLGFLQLLLFVSLFLLVALGGVMLLMVYRQTVAPLRAQLVESRASVEREEKLAALGTLAAGVAHEIRNPLTAINVRVHGLKRTLVPGSSEHEDAAVIGQEIQRLDRIVREFLQFARPPDAQFVTVCADLLLGKVQGLLDAQLDNTPVQLIVEPAPKVWIQVDPQQMEQVLINLVQNAAESIERDGTITLRARSSVARLGGRSRPVVILEVADTGKGMPPAVQKRLFDPFFTTKESGTGLGLPIAARIVEKHGGVLQCHTEVGRGTTFGIVLPRMEKDKNEGQA
jgi:signal transduction histidine kinase